MPTTLDKVESDGKFRSLFVGPTGIGKTIAATSWPGNYLILDFDNRIAPVRAWYKDRLKDFNYELVHAGNFWENCYKVVNTLVSNNPYANILLDGITGMSTTAVMMQMMAKGGLQSGNAPAGMKLKVTKGGVVVPEWDEFNGEAMVITQGLETLKSLKCNLFVTAHPINKINAADGSKWTSIVAFGYKVGPMIPGYFDEVYFFNHDFGNLASPGSKRIIKTRPSQDYPDAKTALENLPATIDITDKKLYDVIKEYL